VSRVALLDVNVLVALAWPNHVHHADARRWFRDHSSDGWATTPVTESGFVRISANPRAVHQALKPVEAIEVLRAMRERPGHRFLPDDVELVVDAPLDPTRVVTHAQVTDAHLVAVARRHGAMLATFDRAIESLGSPDSVVVIPTGR
jgi:toxin-antitoxin system PIN domain toxin